MAFRVGQKVVCVDADGANSLKKYEVYTIRDVLSPRLVRWKHRGVTRFSVTIHLHEAEPNPGDIGFVPERFRPIVERKTDISVFTDILRKASRKHGADA